MDTSFLTGNALTVKLWSEKLRRDVLKSLFFTSFMGSGSDSIIQVNDKMMNNKGDNITFGLRMRSTDAGQSSSTTGITLEGNEEALTFYSDSVSLSEYGHSAKAQSQLTEQRTAFDLRTEIKGFLQDWATEKLEILIVTALATSPSANRYVDSSADVITLGDIQALRRKAILATPKIRPVRIKGRNYYVLLVHPMVMKSLKADTDFKAYNKDARDRGIDNPLIQGADFVVDGICIYEYDRDQLAVSGLVYRTLLLGAQAGLVAWSAKPSWLEKMFDYGTKYGGAVKMICGVKKAVFNSEDYGVVAIDNLTVADA